MKKLALIIVMLFTINNLAAQEIKKFYTHASTKKSETAQEVVESTRSVVVLNYQGDKVALVTPEVELILQLVGKISKDTIKGKTFQAVEVKTPSGNYGTLFVFDDPKIGTILLLGEAYISFYTK